MMKINRNIHLLMCIPVCVISAHATAGVALIFDSPNLIVYEQKSSVFGFYACENEKFSCDFLFMSNHDGKYLYDQRNTFFDVPGEPHNYLIVFVFPDQ